MSKVTESQTPRLTWTEIPDRSYPHLTRLMTEYRGLRIAIYPNHGNDFNARMEREGRAKRLYPTVIVFPNTSNQELLDLRVETHTIANDYYRESLEEVQITLEAFVTDLANLLSGSIPFGGRGTKE